MSSLDINERNISGYGWTDSPVLIYPSATQTARLNRIIAERDAGGDERAAGTTEDIRDMLNDEDVLSQEDRWRYTIPDELAKVETDTNTEFAIRALGCEPLHYLDDEFSAAPIPNSAASISDYTKERAVRYLALANRINELRKMSELHYRHVHKVYYVYEDHAGYALDGPNAAIGGAVQPREYVGAVTTVNQLKGIATIARGSSYIDYTKPAKFAPDRAFNPAMFSGVKLYNPNRASKAQIPVLSRVFPDLGVRWIQDFGDVSQQDIDANWNAVVRNLEPTSVKAEHINEIRRTLSAYAAHTHDVVLQTIDTRAIDARLNSDYNTTSGGTAFDITPLYTDVVAPRYLSAIGACLDNARPFINNPTGLEIPLTYWAYYHGKNDTSGNLLRGLKGLLIYNNFQKVTFADEFYPNYIENPEGTVEDSLMNDHEKNLENLLYHHSATDFAITLTDTNYIGDVIYKAANIDPAAPSSSSSGGVPEPVLVDPLMVPIPAADGPLYFETVTLQERILEDRTADSPGYYLHGTGASIDGDLDDRAILYDTDGLLGNTGYVKVVFQPKGLESLAIDIDQHIMHAGGIHRRAILFSHGRDDCSGVTWSPAACTRLPKMEFNHKGNYASLANGNAEHYLNLFCMVPDEEDLYKRKVYNAVGAMPLNSDHTGSKFLQDYTTTRLENRESGGAFGVGKAVSNSLRWYDKIDDEDSKYVTCSASYGNARAYAGDGEDGRGLLNTGTAGNDYFFRQENYTPDEDEIMALPEVEESMENLIEIWLEPSKFRYINGYPSEDTYTIHAAILDSNGGLVMHLAGDILITADQTDHLCEVKVSYDLRPDKESYLAAGLSSLKESAIIPTTVSEFVSTNNRVAATNDLPLAVDDMIVVTGSTSNDGVYPIRKVEDGNFYVQTQDGSTLIDETPGAPLQLSVYRYTQTDNTEVLCTIESGMPTDQSSCMDGISKYTYSHSSYIWAFYEESDNFDFWYCHQTPLDKMFHGREFPHHYQAFYTCRQNLTDGDYDSILENYSLLHLSYKSVNSQMIGFYRASELAPYSNDVMQPSFSDFNSLDKVVESGSASNKAVVSLGNSICGLNNKGNGSMYSYDPLYPKRRLPIRPLHRPINDMFYSANRAGAMPISEYSRLTGLYPSTDYNGERTPPTVGGDDTAEVIVAGIEDVSIGDPIKVYFSDIYETKCTTIDYIVLDLEIVEATYRDATYNATKIYLVTTAGARFDMDDVVNDLESQRPVTEYGTSRFGMRPAYVQVTTTDIEYVKPTYPTQVSDLYGARSFVFKSVLVSAEPAELVDTPVHTSTFVNVKSGSAIQEEYKGESITVTGDGLKESAYNNDPRSALVRHLNITESSTAGTFAGARLTQGKTSTEASDGGDAIMAAFTNGLYASDNYKIRQLKGSTRDPNTGKKIEDGDPIRAADINELYSGMKWLMRHTHAFEFTHKTDQFIYIADAT